MRAGGSLLTRPTAFCSGARSRGRGTSRSSRFTTCILDFLIRQKTSSANTLDRGTYAVSRALLPLTSRSRVQLLCTSAKSACTPGCAEASSISSITLIRGTFRTTFGEQGSESSSTHLGANTAANLSWSFDDEIPLTACLFVSPRRLFSRCGGRFCTGSNCGGHRGSDDLP